MRKPRDLDQELNTLLARAKGLRERKLRQLGELIIATGADALDAETLVGGLLALVDSATPERKESWRNRGRGFFQRRTRAAGRQAQGNISGDQTGDSGEAATGREPGAA